MNEVRSQPHHGSELSNAVLLGLVRNTILPMQGGDETIEALLELVLSMVEVYDLLNCLSRDEPCSMNVEYLKSEF